jgi:hypothetical protein
MTALDRRYDTQIHRRVTRTVMVGGVPIGSEHPIAVQSMINEDTLDIDGSVAGIIRLSMLDARSFASRLRRLVMPRPWGKLKLNS